MLRRHSDRSNLAKKAGQQNLEPRTPRGPARFWRWVLPLILVTWLGALMINVVDVPNHEAMNDRNAAILAAETFVRGKLNIGIVPRFAPKEWVKADQEKENWTVSSWLEVMPRSGIASATYEYYCTVTKNGDGAWVLVDLDLHKQ